MAIKAVGIGEDGSFKGRALTWLQATFASKTHEHVGVHQQDVTGATAVTVTNGHLYELTGTGAATVTLSGTVGAQVAIRWAGVAGTVAGAVVTDGNTYVAVRWSAGWTVLQVGVPAVPDTTNPTAGTLSVTVATTTATLTVTGAMDDVALHATPYAYSKDNGATWSAWQADATYEFSGLASGTSFTFRHRVRDAAGNVKQGTAVTRSTDVAPSWTTWAGDTFTAADGALAGRSTPTGGKAWSVNSSAWAHGESAGIVSNKLRLTGTSFTRVSAGVGYPPLSSGQAHVRVSVDYDLTVLTAYAAEVFIDTNSSGQAAVASFRSGAPVTFGSDSNDTWGTPTVSVVPPSSGTAVIEYWRKTDGSLTFTATVGATVVLAVAGTAAPYREQPTSSQQVGLSVACSTPDLADATFDNVLVEYAS